MASANPSLSSTPPPGLRPEAHSPRVNKGTGEPDWPQPDRGDNLDQYRDLSVPWNGGITVKDFQEHLASLTPAERKIAVDSWVLNLSLFLDTTGFMLSAFATWAQKDVALMEMYPNGREGFRNAYPALVEAGRYRERRIGELSRSIRWYYNNEAQFMTTVIAAYSPDLLQNIEGMGSVAYCFRRLASCQPLARMLNTLMFQRIGAKGRSKQPSLHAQDWKQLKDRFQEIPSYIASWMDRHPTSSVTKQLHAHLTAAGVKSHAAMVALEFTIRNEGGKLAPAQVEFWKLALVQYMKDNTVRSQSRVVVEVSPEWLAAHGMRPLQPMFGILVPRLPGSADSSELGQAKILLSQPGTPKAGRTLYEIQTPLQEIAFLRGEPVTTAHNQGGRPIILHEGWEQRQDDSDSSLAPIESMRRDKLGRHSIQKAALDVEDGDTVARQQSESLYRAARALSAFSNLPRAQSVPLAPPLPSQRATRATAQLWRRRPDLLRALDEDLEEHTVIASIEDDEGARDTQITQKNTCKCANPTSHLVKMLGRLSPTTYLDDAGRKKVSEAWYREVVNNAAGEDQVGNKPYAPSRVCWLHTRLVASRIGLKIRAMSQDVTQTTLRAMYHRRDLWGQFQSDPVTSNIFRSHYQTALQNKDLASYRYRPAIPQPHIDWDRMITAMGWEDDVKEFSQYGSINVDCFKWVLDDPELKEVLDTSYNLYDWHQREIGGQSNLGWCRVMYHSLIQQLVRGDVEYYMRYASLRKRHMLLSYPYYVKYVKGAGENTYFRHIDCNIHEATFSGRGKDLIQGSVSWDPEDDDNCTEVLLGFPAIAAEYQGWRNTSGRKHSTSYIEGWDDKRDWPEECRKRWPNVSWVKVPCKPGEIRISHPLLPHGSTGPSTKPRRTVLPWFCCIQPDHRTMEIPEMGTYAEIQHAHQSCTAAPTSPSGHPNKYGGTRWTFPGETPPEFTSYISKAVHCQVRWDSPVVVDELRTLFAAPDGDTIRAFIDKTRAATKQMVLRHWELQQEWEKHAFGPDPSEGIPDRSFFSNLAKQKVGRGKVPTHPITPDFWKYDGHVSRVAALSALWQEAGLERDEALLQAATSDRSPSPESSEGDANSPSLGYQAALATPRSQTTPTAAAASTDLPLRQRLSSSLGSPLARKSSGAGNAEGLRGIKSIHGYPNPAPSHQAAGSSDADAGVRRSKRIAQEKRQQQ